MNGLARLGSYELSAPDTWASIPVVEGDPGWAQEAAALLRDGEADQTALAAKLERTHPELIAGPHLLLGVWAPDRSAPDAAGLTTVDGVLPDEGQPLDRSYYRGLIDPDRHSGHTVFNRQVDEVEIPAGPALLVREVIARQAPLVPATQDTAGERHLHHVPTVPLRVLLFLLFQVHSVPAWLYVLGAVSAVLREAAFIDTQRGRRPG